MYSVFFLYMNVNTWKIEKTKYNNYSHGFLRKNNKKLKFIKFPVESKFYIEVYMLKPIQCNTLQLQSFTLLMWEQTIFHGLVLLAEDYASEDIDPFNTRLHHSQTFIRINSIFQYMSSLR